ncbi:MAG: hypothetical protein JWM85_762, partial [Acidimicrobiaceae bacterium]|nr:hypothetical protein [Acidimicrobiaceae bacterium]
MNSTLEISQDSPPAVVGSVVISGAEAQVHLVGELDIATYPELA